MIEQNTITRMETALDKLMAEKAGQSGGRFERRLAKSIRRAPRRVKKAAGALLQARSYAGHPKLVVQIDERQLDRHFTTLINYLRSIDLVERRKGLVLSILGGVGFSLLLVFGLFVGWMVWRGYL